MAQLIVSALSEDTIAAPGNRNSNYIIISVMDLNGAAVTGLNASNFKVDPIIVGPGGALVDIESVTASARMAGFYLMRVVPINTQTWKSGVYIFTLSVERNTDRGQAMTKVLMD